MSIKNQNLAFAFCLAGSLYLLVGVVPAAVHPKKISVTPLPSSEIPLADRPQIEPENTGAIQFKASGEETVSEFESPNSYAYLDVRAQFEKRFGHSFDVAWEPQEKVHHDFEVLPEIEEQVNFWTHIFGKYGRDTYVFHHAEDVRIVYSVIDLAELKPDYSGLTAAESNTLIQQYVAQERGLVKKKLEKLIDKIKNEEKLTKEEKRLVKLFQNNPDISLEKAAESENIRIQRGFAERFKKAIVLSGQYMEEMENIFSMQELPIELTRIPLIESAFDIKAYSSANAAGLWQFIPDTGKRYLTIDKFVDERYDPILATYAAAEHLQSEYELLGAWPLAINAYNTGPGRMLQAIKQLNTKDIGVIINNFKGAGYKFYSRNYYPEFLAALHVYNHQEEYFGPFAKMAPIKYDLFSPPVATNVRALAKEAKVPLQVMSRLNPALSVEVLRGNKLLPPGYIVRVPQKMGNLFAKAAKKQHQENTEFAELPSPDEEVAFEPDEKDSSLLIP